MKTIFRSYKFELHPNKKQINLLDKHFGSVRFVFNHFLNERKEQYDLYKKSDNYYNQAEKLTQLKKKIETAWLKEVNSQSLQFALKSLDNSYQNFFSGRTRFPRFKSKKNKNTFTVPQFVSIDENRLHIPKFKGGIKVNIHRHVKGKIGKCTLSKTPIGKYFVSILSEEQYEPKEKTGAVCGIDLGLKNLVITSDGKKYANNKYTRQYETKLAKAQQHLSRKIKGSNSFEKQRRKLASIHEKISNSRMDNLHKLSNDLISKYDVICIEDLDVGKMVKSRNFAKNISDASWGTFVKFLEYKADWNDKKVVKINRFFPSSKMCHKCGWINKELTISTRKWTCKNGHKLDRDLNAAKNILKVGLKIYGQGLSITKVESDKSLKTKRTLRNLKFNISQCDFK